MKKSVLSLLSILMLSSISIAQTTSEAFQLSNNQLYGTARYNGLSGAFGALGGDLTAVSENPAASAVFNNSFGSLTLAQGGSNFDTEYFGTISETDEAGFYFNQAGGVLILRNNNNRSNVDKVALAFNYNKTNDFDSQYVIQGNTNNTIGDFFVGQANGIRSGDLRLIDGESITEAYVAIGNTPEYGAVGQQAFLGFQSELIEVSDVNDENAASYFSNSDGANTFQDTSVITTGSAGKASLNLAAAYKSGLHLGGNLNLHTFYKNKQVNFREENDFARVGYTVDESNVGAGLSADVGLIYKTNDNFRLGLVYQTPTYYSVSTEVDQFISVDFAVPDGADAEFVDVDPGVIYEYELYSLRTPGKLAASAAYVFGKKGLLSFEYNSQDFSSMRYGDDFSGATEINNLIVDTFQRVHTYKLGAEIKNNSWSFRGGFSRSTTPYRDVNLGGDTSGYSLGTGYDWGQWRLDVAYNHTDVNTGETTFENTLYTNTANIEEKRDRVTVTLGLNF